MRIKPAKERFWIYASGASLLLAGLGLRAVQHPQATVASAVGFCLLILGLGLSGKAVLDRDDQEQN